MFGRFRYLQHDWSRPHTMKQHIRQFKSWHNIWKKMMSCPRICGRDLGCKMVAKNLCNQSQLIKLHTGLVTFKLHAGLVTFKLHAGLVTFKLHAGLVTFKLHAGLVTFKLHAGLVTFKLYAGLVTLKLHAGLVTFKLHTSLVTFKLHNNMIIKYQCDDVSSYQAMDVSLSLSSFRGTRRSIIFVNVQTFCCRLVFHCAITV